jgi:hypothetical protein
VKLTFEGESMLEIIQAMEYVVADYQQLAAFRDVKRAAVKAQDPGPGIVPSDNVLVDSPVDSPVDKPVETSGAEKARKMREAKAAKAAAAKPPGEEPAKAPITDVNEIIRIRQRTINDLQEAYANGHQKEVFDLLSRFGNGAKSFRELTAESFLPIREAIDSGALK